MAKEFFFPEGCFNGIFLIRTAMQSHRSLSSQNAVETRRHTHTASSSESCIRHSTDALTKVWGWTRRAMDALAGNTDIAKFGQWMLW